MSKLRTLLWAYLALLMFEGALRKWIVPQLDAPLLIVRDPIVLWIYYEAYRHRLSFNNAFFMPVVVIGVITTLLSLVFGIGNLAITFYGIHTDYLQIPLIFLIPQILNRDDVVMVGKWLLYLSLPMAVLVIFQFRSDPDSLVNKGAIHTWYGTVRPSGTFSYIAGLVAYYAIVASFLFYGYLNTRAYPLWLVIAVTCDVALCTACSGSRTFIVSVGIVMVASIVCVLLRGKGGLGILIAAVSLSVVLPILSMLPVFKDGAYQLTRRFQDGAANGEDTSGFLNRYAETMVQPLAVGSHAQLWGMGLGSGTNFASSMLRGEREFIGAEDEWGRLFFESGPIFGLLLILLRVSLTLAIAKTAYDALRRDNPLPLLIFAGCAVSILNGQWGVPTSLGFAILGAGLTLAACVEPYEDDEYEDEDEESDQAEDESEHSPTSGTVA
jgi:hypothetical protein